MDLMLQDEYEKTSHLVPISNEELQGFGNGYTLRNHKDEDVVNNASYTARQDWIRYVGPIETFGGCNPYHGNFTSLTLPFTQPERVAICAYFIEYAFLYDDICESANKALEMDPQSDGLILDHSDSVVGAKQMNSRIMLELYEIDEPCGKRMIEKWKTGMSVTRQLKNERPYSNLEEYIPFRGLDTGAPFVEAIMLFGMGVQLTDEDDALVKDIVAPAYAALGLANDYFSFDREFQEHESSRRDSMDLEPMTNAVWLCMQWYNMSILEAKDMVRRETVKYEDEFERKKREFLHSDPTPPEKLWRCLDGLSQMIIGNLAWSLQCPRYSPTLRYDANAGVENEFLDTKPPEVKDLRDACAKVALEMAMCSSDGKRSDSDYDSWTGRSQEAGPCRKASGSRVSSLSLESANDLKSSHQVVMTPFEYCASLPSKNVRSALVDAFSIWLPTPLPMLEQIKSIGHLLHNASLLLDDVQDGSALRRGKPAAHTVFGMPETINSANFAILEAMEKVSGLQAPSFAMFSGQMRKLYIGQGQDLNWARQKSCPTESEYLEMVDGKTGGLFHLLVGLLRCNSPVKTEGLANDQIKDLVTKLGRHFQIRDDYKNLASSVYGSQKGFCEDFDEGKYSYPVVCALNQTEHDVSILRSILANSTKDGFLANELKQLALDQLTSFRSLEKTEETMRHLHSEVLAQINQIEAQLGSKNWILRLLVKKLEVHGGEF